MNVLYVEDNPNDAQLVKRFFGTTSHNLVVVNNLREAKQIVKEEQIHMLLLDLILDSQQVGYDFANTLRENGYDFPIIAITALAGEDSAAACRDAGIDYVLSKPYSIVTLAETLQLFEQ